MIGAPKKGHIFNGRLNGAGLDEDRVTEKAMYLRHTNSMLRGRATQGDEDIRQRCPFKPF